MTYNVFSGTLNPTHFTSLHFTVNSATAKMSWLEMLIQTN